jgi:hypothetical protein
VGTDVQRGGEQARGSERRHMGAVSKQRDGEADKRDACVLHGRVAEEAAEIVLCERIRDPGERRDGSDDQQRVAAPGRQRPEHREFEPPQAIEAGAQRDRQRRRAQSRA